MADVAHEFAVADRVIFVSLTNLDMAEFRAEVAAAERRALLAARQAQIEKRLEEQDDAVRLGRFQELRMDRRTQPARPGSDIATTVERALSLIC